MARTVTCLPAGRRIAGSIGLGVIAKLFLRDTIRQVLAETGRTSVRQRDLLAHVVVSCVIALALSMRSSTRELPRCLLEAARWQMDPPVKVKVAGKPAISQARSRLRGRSRCLENHPATDCKETVSAVDSNPGSKVAGARRF